MYNNISGTLKINTRDLSHEKQVIIIFIVTHIYKELLVWMHELVDENAAYILAPYLELKVYNHSLGTRDGCHGNRKFVFLRWKTFLWHALSVRELQIIQENIKRIVSVKQIR